MEMLETGDTAPDFTGIDGEEKEHTLTDYRGKRLILYFYPKDNTPGCTAEACSLRDGYSELLEKGFTVLGVSPDGASSHRKFAQKHALPYPLISDADHKIALAYGVWGEKKFMGRTYDGIHRTTFVIDPDGKIELIFRKVNTKAHFEQILDSYE